MRKNKLLRMDNVSIVVEDLDGAIAFFVELGMEIDGETTVEGQWVDRVVGLNDVKSDIVVLRTPDRHGKLELTKFHWPTSIKATQNQPVNMLGMGRVMFAVTDIDDVIVRLKKHGATLVGEVVQYEDMYRLCYLRGPEGMIIALAEHIGDTSATS